MRAKVRKGISLVLVSLVSAAVGIFLGQLVSNYELRFMLSREYRGEQNGIEIYVTGEIDEDNLRRHEEMLAKAPPQLTECCDRLYFTGTDLDLPDFDGSLGSALGLTQYRTVFISTESFSSYVVFHELFHAYDNFHGDLSANSPDFLAAYEANCHAIPLYASHYSAYPSEFFAQMGAFYLLMPQELYFAAPETFAYFDSLL